MNHGRVRPRIGWIVATIALVPLAGLIWFASQQIRTATDHRDEAQVVGRSAERSVALVQLGSALADEKHWTHALNALTDIGVDPNVVGEVIGIDIVSELDHATSDVDNWLQTLQIDDLTALVRDVRADSASSTVDTTRAFQSIEDTIETMARSEIDALLRSAANLPGGDRLVDAARVLESAAEVRSDIAWQFGAFFGTRFTIDRTPAEETRILISRTDRYLVNVERLARLAPPGSRTHAALPVVLADPDVKRFAGYISSMIDDAMVGLLDDAGAADISGAVDNAAEMAETFTVSVNATDAHLALVEAAAADVSTQATLMGTTSDRELTYALAFWLFVTLLSGLIALAATRFIVEPLRRLSHTATTLRSGYLDVAVDERGPREIQTAARAMNEAIGQLKLAELQAMALAEGEVDDPVLDSEAPGLLGTSLRRAVAHLTDSLTEREEFRRRLAHEAAHDGLTGLANRRAAISHLGHAMARTSRSAETLAVLFVDLDGFKAVNDLHGHRVGDRVLTQIAQRLGLAIRDGDLAGRLGGDEFIVIAEPIIDEDDAVVLANRIAAAIGRPMLAAGATIVPHCSIGIALPSGHHTSAEELVHDADLAVYEAKRKGRGRIEVCVDALRSQVAERGVVERGLATAITNSQLELYFQTIASATTTQPASIEALVRWHHPERGLVSPGVFIAVAERSDLILDLDQWVLNEAARHLALWTDDDVLGQLSLAVNLSSRHLSHPDLADQVLNPLRQHGVDPARVVLEVTESALLDDLASAADHLRELRDHGMRVAIDDFGTGYTSLTHLRSLPADILKIDQSYTMNLHREDEAALVHLIIDTGHLLGLQITAEGIETEEQAEILTAMGADFLQGFHFSRPGPADQLVDSLSKPAAVVDTATAAPATRL